MSDQSPPSDEHQATETPQPDGAGGKREPQPGDVPKPIVWAVVIVAVLVSGFVGWKRYEKLREETMREVQAQAAEELRRVNEELRERREQREREAADAAAQGGESQAVATSTVAED